MHLKTDLHGRSFAYDYRTELQDFVTQEEYQTSRVNTKLVAAKYRDVLLGRSRPDIIFTYDVID